MNDFLNNPEERIAEFNSPIEDRVQKTKSIKENIKTKSSRKKNNESDEIISESRLNDTIQIRISRNVDRQLREMIWHIFVSTGKKTCMREFVDQALLEYIDNWKKKNS